MASEGYQILACGMKLGNIYHNCRDFLIEVKV
jgi:hypothetical protein